jgi:2-polyprenyl-3-methyl-5-hydroxy-6-metoxy-1,4-benzoquinol methylase
MKKYKENKIFVTGISGSGKTTFAKKYSNYFNIEYFNFDDNWVYYSDGQYENIIKKYPTQFITDAIPYTRDDNNSLRFIQDYYKNNENDIKIICICCTDINEFDNRVKDKFYTNKKEAYFAFYSYYFFDINEFSKLNIEYYDSFYNEFISKTELLNKIKDVPNYLKKIELKEHLEIQTYDKKYQDIECIDFIGYSESFKTWDTIKDLIDWNGKMVADVGCFHCYFAFKIAKLGGFVTALDINESVLLTANYLNIIEGKIINLKKWSGGDEISSDYDVTLCLNVIHHFSDIKNALHNIKSKFAIFETNTEFIDIISDDFNILKKLNSHRVDFKGNARIILLCEKKIL